MFLISAQSFQIRIKIIRRTLLPIHRLIPDRSTLRNLRELVAATKDVRPNEQLCFEGVGQCTLDLASSILGAETMQVHGHATAGPPNTPGGDSVPTFLAKLSRLFAASLPRPLLHELTPWGKSRSPAGWTVPTSFAKCSWPSRLLR